MERLSANQQQTLDFSEVCKVLSITEATGRNWIRLGKIKPQGINGKRLLFSRADITEILHAIQRGDIKALNQRRNKKQVNKLSAYESYISNQHNKMLVNEIISKYGQRINPAIMRLLLANFALQLIYQKYGHSYTDANLISQYLERRLDIGKYRPLIDDLIGDYQAAKQELVPQDDLYQYQVRYVRDDDTLGFVYISLVNLGQRKLRGAYYTSLEVVHKLVKHVTNTHELSGKTVFDPCCGSGNFLLEVGEHTNTPRLIYGQDIDPMAIYLVRISFALKFGIVDLDFLYGHFVCADAFASLPQQTFDVIIGNPPWGGEISAEKIEVLAANYRTAQEQGSETFSLFIEYGLSILSDQGILAFVIPQAMLNVRAHSMVREIILHFCNFKFVHYLGNMFCDVNCPAIILGVEKSQEKKSGIKVVHHKEEQYSISSNRQFTVEQFNFHVTDQEQDCLDALSNAPKLTTLSGQAKFALGIVTGNNSRFTSSIMAPGYEVVLKGSDITKYQIAPGQTYIDYNPDSFQQVAPSNMYRAKEKLLYRFICDSLVFAYDDQQTLSLNSCNIVIPQVPNLAIKYILAILNSRAASYYFVKMCSSIKVLRSHIEQIPIPIVAEDKQQQIIAMVDKLIAREEDKSHIYDELDEMIMNLYRLNTNNRRVIVDTMTDRNLFLV